MSSENMTLQGLGKNEESKKSKNQESKGSKQTKKTKNKKGTKANDDESTPALNGNVKISLPTVKVESGISNGSH